MPKIIIDEETIKAAKIGTGTFKNLNPLEVVRWIEEKSQTLTDEEVGHIIDFHSGLAPFAPEGVEDEQCDLCKSIIKKLKGE